jgi:hypothetical protein
MPDLPQNPNRLSQNLNGNFAPMFVNASFQRQQTDFETANERKPTFAKEVKIAPKQTLEIEIPVEQAASLSLIMMANSSISATLLNDKGAIVGTNLAGSPESKGFFRTIYFDKPVANGTWKLKLENTGTFESPALLAL